MERTTFTDTQLTQMTGYNFSEGSNTRQSNSEYILRVINGTLFGSKKGQFQNRNWEIIGAIEFTNGYNYNHAIKLDIDLISDNKFDAIFKVLNKNLTISECKKILSTHKDIVTSSSSMNSYSILKEDYIGSIISLFIDLNSGQYKSSQWYLKEDLLDILYDNFSYNLKDILIETIFNKDL